MGVQGPKRVASAGADIVATVDKFVEHADFSDIQEVPLDAFDSAILCVPDNKKPDILRYLLRNGKNVLVEKPFVVSPAEKIEDYEALAKKTGAFCMTAYNHRFEPAVIEAKNSLEQGNIGEVYSCRIFYGNGTASLVRASSWRDQGDGVLSDLGSHALDLLYFWFDIATFNFDLCFKSNFENLSPDHILFVGKEPKPKIQVELTFLSWKNYFSCDLIGEHGSIHIKSLCKWGPAEFIFRNRKHPAGMPDEQLNIKTMPDPTWNLEYEYFKNACLKQKKTDLASDKWISKKIAEIRRQF